jgi:tetratricopeptide (TPR) repeat protein
MALGDFDGALCFAREAQTIGQSIGGGWDFLNGLNLSLILCCRGDLDQAIEYFRSARDRERPSFHTGILSGALFQALAMKGDPEMENALAEVRLDLPVAGGPLCIGSCDCLALVLEGLAVLGRREEAAALDTVAEHVAAKGAVCVWSQNLMRTSAGIAAAAACRWERAEEHFRTAIQQAGCAPYKTAQPIARLRYADMLLARDLASDRERARELLREALLMCQTVGMTWYAQHIEQRIQGAVAGVM